MRSRPDKDTFAATGEPGTCLWCGCKLRKEYDNAANAGYASSGVFCRLPPGVW